MIHWKYIYKVREPLLQAGSGGSTAFYSILNEFRQVKMEDVCRYPVGVLRGWLAVVEVDMRWCFLSGLSWYLAVIRAPALVMVMSETLVMAFRDNPQDFLLHTSGDNK